MQDAAQGGGGGGSAGSSGSAEHDREMEVAERGVDAFINRADNLCRSGKNDEAIQYLDRALRLCLKKLGPDHPKTALARTKRAVAPRLRR